LCGMTSTLWHPSLRQGCDLSSDLVLNGDGITHLGGDEICYRGFCLLSVHVDTHSWPQRCDLGTQGKSQINPFLIAQIKRWTPPEQIKTNHIHTLVAPKRHIQSCDWCIWGKMS
jgi:hypothetical protein